ncbi:hypothetical protein HRbin16_00341 [bacterium HR16]|nr:hypothetical protein HRbin16_00341 [bacterium HR16]
MWLGKVAAGIGVGIVGIAVVVAAGLLLTILTAIPTYYLWNWLMPAIFGLKKVTLWQAWGINILTWLLFQDKSTSRCSCEECSRKADDEEKVIIVPGR